MPVRRKIASTLAILAALGALVACEKETETAAAPPAGLAGEGAAASQPAGGGAPTDPIVEVGGTTLTRAEYERAMFRDATMAGLPPPSKEPRVRELIEAPALEKMIDRELLRAEAEKRGLLPQPEAVEAERQKLLAQLQGGKTFEDVLKAMGVDEATFLADLRTDIGIAELLKNEQAQVVPLDDAALKQIYDENPELYAQRESASASHILVKVAPDAPPDVVAAAEKKAKAIRDEVVGKDKETFARVAVEKSEDPSAKINRGDLGTFERKDMLPDFSDAAFKLAQGEVSPVVRTDKGFHVIYGQGVTKGAKRTFDEVKAEILEKEMTRRRIDSVESLVKKLRSTVAIKRHYDPKPSPLLGGRGPAGPGGPASMPAGGPHGAPHGGAPPPAPMGAPPAGAGAHPEMPLPSKDNVLPGAPNPHAGGGGGGGELKLKLDPK